jgi:hypothetical protein
MVAACVGCCVGVVGWPASASAEGSSSSVGGVSLLGDPLVVAAAEPLVVSQSAEAEAVVRTSPEAVAAREASSSSYEGLDAEASEKLVGEADPRLVNEPLGGPPRLPVGERIVSFPADDAGTLELPGGGHGVLSSLSSIATEAPGGGRVPIDLGLSEIGGGFQPRVPAAGVRVRIPKRLADGPSLDVPSLGGGVSLVPVAGDGSVLGGVGVPDGASVFYGDSEDVAAGVVDTDTLVKPDVYGFSEETILRSQRSPQRLFFRVGLPVGGSLVAAQGGSGAVGVVVGGRTIGVILAPSARDAAGSVVPVSMSVVGDTLVLDVVHRPGEFLMPIVVDPTVEERELCGGDWGFYTDNTEAFFHGGTKCESDRIYDSTEKTYLLSQFGFIAYTTQKESRIFKFSAKVYAETVPHEIEGAISLRNSTGSIEKEANQSLPGGTGWQGAAVCAEAGCGVPVVSGSQENSAEMKVSALETGKSDWSYDLSMATQLGSESVTAVSISQERVCPVLCVFGVMRARVGWAS